MKPFTYVIAPDGCADYLTPGRKYSVVLDPEFGLGNGFNFIDDNNNGHFASRTGIVHNGNNAWIIPEIGQWPDGWTDRQKIDCLENIGLSIIEFLEYNFGDDWLEQGRSMREKNLTAFGWTIPIYKAIKWIAGLFVITIIVACSKPDIRPKKSTNGFIQREKTL